MSSNKLVPRKLQESDWETLQKWWDYWPGVKTPPRDFLPDNGTGGIMIEKNGMPIIAGFIYETNSCGAMVEWIISNPNYRGKKKRDEALEALIVSIEAIVESLGYKIMFTMISNKKIINLRKKFGWVMNPKPLYTHIKIL